MSDIACHCGRRGALFQKQDGTLLRWWQCREHLDAERVKREGLGPCVYPPSMPEIFRDTDLMLLHPKIRQQVEEWNPSGDKSGLLFHGNSGVGKTRGLWEVVRRAWVKETEKSVNMKFMVLTMRKFEGMIEKGFQDKEHAEVIEGIINAKLLAIDDFGKERLTSRLASDFFAVIDERSTARRPTIITTNFNGSALIERFENRDKETGVALIRRLKDYYTCVGIGVDSQTSPAN